MKKDINQALANVEITYDDLLEIANNITSPIFSNMNQLVNNINENINNMTPDSLTKSMLKLSTLSLNSLFNFFVSSNTLAILPPIL